MQNSARTHFCSLQGGKPPLGALRWPRQVVGPHGIHLLVPPALLEGGRAASSLSPSSCPGVPGGATGTPRDPSIAWGCHGLPCPTGQPLAAPSPRLPRGSQGSDLASLPPSASRLFLLLQGPPAPARLVTPPEPPTRPLLLGPLLPPAGAPTGLPSHLRPSDSTWVSRSSACQRPWPTAALCPSLALAAQEDPELTLGCWCHGWGQAQVSRPCWSLVRSSLEPCTPTAIPFS